jgi:hypothetical protein
MLLACAGCAEVQHLDQALVLKAYSDEKDAQNAYVQQHDMRFEDMMREAQRPDAFKRHSSKTDIARVFGDPIFCRSAQGLEECLYRRIVKPMESPKIYLYFNAQGDLVRWTGGSL